MVWDRDVRDEGLLVLFLLTCTCFPWLSVQTTEWHVCVSAVVVTLATEHSESSKSWKWVGEYPW